MVARLLSQVRESKDTELGSLAPLGIGLAMLSLSVVLLMLGSGSLYLTERRLTTLAEATALAVLVDSQGKLDQPLSPLALEWLEKQSFRGLNRVELIEVSSEDNRTVLVRLCSSSLPIVANYMFSEIGKVCSEALARRGR